MNSLRQSVPRPSNGVRGARPRQVLSASWIFQNLRRSQRANMNVSASTTPAYIQATLFRSARLAYRGGGVLNGEVDCLMANPMHNMIANAMVRAQSVSQSLPVITMCSTFGARWRESRNRGFGLPVFRPLDKLKSFIRDLSPSA